MLELSAKDFCHVYFPRWFEISGGCGVLHKVIYINSAGIIFEVILEKSKSEGAMIVFVQPKHMTNSKPCYGCLPNTWNPSSLSSLTLSCCCCSTGSLSRPDSSSNPLNKLLLLCPPGLLHWRSSKYPLLHAPAIWTVVLLCWTGYPAYHTHHTSPHPSPSLGTYWALWSPVYFFFLLLSTLCALYIKTYFIHDKSLPVIDLMLWPYMQGDVCFSHLVPSSLLPQFSAVPSPGILCSCSQAIHHHDSGLNHDSLYSFNTYFRNSPLDLSEICLFLWLHKALISTLLLQRWSVSTRIQLFRPTPW